MVAWRTSLAVVGAVLALAVLTAGPAAAHAGDPTLAGRLDGVAREPPAGVEIAVPSTISDQLVVPNRTATPPVALDPDGAEFLALGPDGVAGNTSSPSFHLTAAPPEVRVPVPPPGTGPNWVSNGRATGSPWSTVLVVAGVVLLVAGGGLLLWRNRRLAAAAAVFVVAACGPAALTPVATPDGAQRVELHRGHVVRYAVPVGSTVELVVGSDLADEVHVHGYDRTAYVTAGATVTMRFVADVPGVFEVELERAGEQLGQLAVS